MLCKNIFISVFLFINILLTNSLLIGQADLSVYPSRIIFNEAKKIENIYLTNLGNDTVQYSISFIQYDMTENGGLETVDKSKRQCCFSDSYLKIYPRKLSLGPQETKSVKIQFNATDKMEKKEFRSHLYFKVESELEPETLNSTIDSNQMKFNITPIFGFSIPVIVRNECEKSRCTITDPIISKDNDKGYVIDFIIHREGSVSTYGDIMIDLLKSDGSKIQVALQRGAAIYTNIDKRYFRLLLDFKEVISLDAGKMSIKYVNAENENKEVIAVLDFEVNNN